MAVGAVVDTWVGHADTPVATGKIVEQHIALYGRAVLTQALRVIQRNRHAINRFGCRYWSVQRGQPGYLTLGKLGHATQPLGGKADHRLQGTAYLIEQHKGVTAPTGATCSSAGTGCWRLGGQSRVFACSDGALQLIHTGHDLRGWRHFTGTALRLGQQLLAKLIVGVTTQGQFAPAHQIHRYRRTITGQQPFTGKQRISCGQGAPSTIQRHRNHFTDNPPNRSDQLGHLCLRSIR